MKIAILTAAALLISSCVPAPPPPPSAWQVAPWQPQPIASAAFESHPAFDRRDDALYFVRSTPAFSVWRLMMSECRAGRWTEPRAPSFAGDGVEADPFLSPDGATFWFISSRSEGGARQSELDIWRVSRRRGGGWGAPERLPEPLNSAGNEWFPRPAADGWLYFGSDRPGGLGGTDIYRAREERGRWRVEPLGPGVNRPGEEYEAEISPDGRLMVLMADGDLFLVRRDGDRWAARERLGPEINTPALEVGPTFSPSGRSLLFARDTGAGASGELMLAAGVPEDWPRRCR